MAALEVGDLLRIEGLQNATQHNGKLCCVLELPTDDDADARVVVRPMERGRGPLPAELRVRAANLRRAYVPEPGAEIAKGGATSALAEVMSLFPDCYC